ncbi:MAG TPA: hypothetical protein VF677_12095 [Flavobacterium sp.]
MRHYSIVIIILFMFSCKNKEKKDDICVENLKYVKNEKELIPPLVTLYFKDDNGIIERSMNNDSFETLFFYSFEKENRMQGYMKENHYEKEGGLIKLNVGINYFNDLSRKDWTQKQIEDFLIKDGIGVIIGKDTIIIKKCN